MDQNLEFSLDWTPELYFALQRVTDRFEKMLDAQNAERADDIAALEHAKKLLLQVKECS